MHGFKKQKVSEEFVDTMNKACIKFYFIANDMIYLLFLIF